MKIDPQPSVSYSTGFQYCIENNIAICALIDNYNEQNFEEFQISPVIPPLNTECIISGYPDENTDIPYVYQNYCNETLSDLEIKLKHIFHDYEAQVNSHGLITNIGTNLIEVNCIATSGMSGSPVFLANSNYSLIGIYVGGPPLHGQYELMRIVKTLIDDQDVSKAYESLTNLKPTLPSVDQVHRVYKLGLDIILENLKSYLTNRQEILQSDLDIITNATINILYQLVIHSDELKCLNPSFQFNSVIPVSHPSFNRVGYAVDKFKQCAMNFNGPEELAYFLLN